MRRDNEDHIAAARSRKPTDWQSRGNCIGVEPSLFFPAQGDMAAIRQAREVCGGCAVRAACLEFSNTFPVEEDGIWAGRTATERQKIRMGRPVRELFA